MREDTRLAREGCLYLPHERDMIIAAAELTGGEGRGGDTAGKSTERSSVEMGEGSDVGDRGEGEGDVSTNVGSGKKPSDGKVLEVTSSVRND